MKLNWLKTRCLLPVLLLAVSFVILLGGDARAQTKTPDPSSASPSVLTAPVLTNNVVTPAATATTSITSSTKVADTKEADSSKKKKVPKFDHSRTGFVLDGAHEFLKCEDCHVKGSFKNTPNQCWQCHSAGTSIGHVVMPPNHIQVTTRCEQCHFTKNFYAVNTVDHKEVMGACATCHDGITAVGKSAGHVPTTASCDTCHSSTYSFISATFSHQGIVNNCARCHNGVQATGKGPNHIPTALDCANCHTTVTWNTATYDHTGVTTGCGSCHNGSLAHGKGPAHINTSNTCEHCHTPGALTSGSPVLAGWNTPILPMPHGSDVVGACATCHSTSGNKVIDSYSVEGVVSGTHIPLTGSDCTKCHVTTAWNPASITPMDHSQVSTTCTACHKASGGDSTTYQNITIDGVNGALGTHIPITAGAVCSKCHTTSAWNPYLSSPMDHTYVSGTCAACHDPSANYTNVTLDSKTTGAGALITHPTTSLACNSCHTTTVSWQTASYNHTGVTTGCYNCHNNGNSLAKYKGAAHMASSNICEDCHTTGTLDVNGNPATTGWNTPIIPIPHAQFTSTVCSTCHLQSGDQKIDGYLVHGAGGALGAHIPITGADCTKCHVSTAATWQTSMSATLPIMDHTLVSTTCTTCHLTTGDSTKYPNVTIDGLNGTHVPGPHIPLATTDCTKCHQYTSAGWVASLTQALPAMDHTQVSTTCTTCHSATPGASNTTYSNVTIQGEGAAHMTVTSTKCSDCHTTTAWTLASPASFNHKDASATCTTCHGGAATIDGQSMDTTTGGPNFQSGFVHVAINGAQCTTCHTNALTIVPPSWYTASIDHTTFSASTDCTGCHVTSNTTGALGTGSVTHIALNATTGAGLCTDCHTVPTGVPGTAATLWVLKAPTAMSHTHTSGLCSSCHNGQTFTGATMDNKTAVNGAAYTHMPITSTVCNDCHTAPAPTATWVLAANTNFNHADTSSSCVTCHGSTTYAGGIVMDNTTKFNGASYTHVPVSTTASVCTNCHTNSYTSWALATANVIDHTQLTSYTNCNTCHSATPGGTNTTYTNITIQGEGASHMAVLSSAICGDCHATTTWNLATTASFKHTDTNYASNCNSCHAAAATIDGQTMDQTTGGPNFPGGFTHEVTNGAQCDTCHTAAISMITTSTPTWLNASTNHSTYNSSTDCTVCHVASNTTGAMGTSAATHIALTVATGAGLCQSCHTIPTGTPPAVATGWVLAAPTAMPHTYASGACSTCHNGQSFTGATMDNTTKFNGGAFTHMPITTTVCTDCHTTPAPSSTWVLAAKTNFNHADTSSTCVTCHGTTTYAGGMAIDSQTSFSGAAYTHMPTNTNCTDCHVTTSWTLAGNGSFNHGDATNISSCVACHGTTTYAGGMVIDSTTKLNGSSYTHIPVSASASLCANCHSATLFTSWALATANVIDHTQVTNVTVCNTCHSATPGGTNTTYTNITIQGEGAAHMSLLTSEQCGDCHATTTWNLATTASFKHTDTNYASNCNSCHAAAATIDGQSMDQTTGGPNFPGGFVHEATAGAQCDTCHTASVSLITSATPTWLNATVNHSSYNSSTDCTTCHAASNTSGAIGTGAVTHIALTAATGAGLCQNCHTTPTGFPAAAVSGWVLTAPTAMPHTYASGACSTCHNGQTFTAVTMDNTTKFNGGAFTHMPITTTVCTDCHTTPAPSSTWVLAAKTNFNHADTSSTCVTCHGTTTYAGGMAIDSQTSFSGAAYTHMPTNTNCTDCHVTTSWTLAGNGSFNHGDATNISSCVACHGTTTYAGGMVIDSTTKLNGSAYNHVPVSASAALCGNCHSGSVFTSWALATANVIDHTQLTSYTTCTTCHSSTPGGTNTTYTNITIQGEGASHMTILAPALCSDCHQLSTWTLASTASFKHADTSYSSNCISCHAGAATIDGQAMDQTTGGPNFPGGGFTHITTNGAQCDTCHTAAISMITSSTPTWLNAVGVDHTTFNTSTNCSVAGCHVASNTSAAIGTGAVTHIALTATSGAGLCQDCHTIPSTASPPAVVSGWVLKAPTNMSHTYVSGACSACHNGQAFTNITMDNLTKYNGAAITHLPITTAYACTNCHSGSNFSSWALPVANAIDHTQLTSYTTCTTCHSSTKGGTNTTYTNVTIQGEGASHMTINAPALCSDCHTLTTWTLTSPASFKHLDVSYTSNCISCHGGAATIDGEVMDTTTSGPNFPGGFTHTTTNGAQCDSCHTPTASMITSATPTWLNASGSVDHTTLTTSSDCTTCHTQNNTTGAMGPAAAVHIPLLTYTGAGLCQDCHAMPTVASPPQVASSWTRKSATTMSHTHVATTCTTCHLNTGNNTMYTNVTVEGAVPNVHYPLSTDATNCVYCHLTTDSSFTAAHGYDHRNQTFGTYCGNCHINGYSTYTMASGIGSKGLHDGLTAATVKTYNCSSCHQHTGAATAPTGLKGQGSFPGG